MKTTHWIRNRDMRDRYRYRPLCTGQWEEHPDKHIVPTGYFRKWEQPDNNILYTNSLKLVTCPGCLEKLIAKHTQELVMLKSRLACSSPLQLHSPSDSLPEHTSPNDSPHSAKTL